MGPEPSLVMPAQMPGAGPAAGAPSAGCLSPSRRPVPSGAITPRGARALRVERPVLVSGVYVMSGMGREPNE